MVRMDIRRHLVDGIAGAIWDDGDGGAPPTQKEIYRGIIAMIAQVGIMIFGLAAAWLSQDRRLSWQRWACVAGLCSQPFWFWSSWQAEQWGIFAISFAYTWCWLRGLRTYWWPR